MRPGTAPVNTTACDLVEETVVVARPDGRIDARICYRHDGMPAWSALIAGPHPLLGGDMNNNVVRRLFEEIANANGLPMRFDYSGVGRSEGGPDNWDTATSAFWTANTIPQELTWIHDARAAALALTRLHPRPMVLMGYSFGCLAVARTGFSAPHRAIVLISPNPKQHDFSALAGLHTPLLVIHSENDFACETATLREWYRKIRVPKRLICMPAGEHFFRGEESAVTAEVLDFVSSTVLDVPGGSAS